MNKFKRKSVEELSFPIREIESVNIVENYPAEMQNINEHGYIRNDISVIMEAQTPADLNFVLNKISQLKRESKYSGMDDKSILLAIKPRLLQSPAEIDKYLKYLDDNLDDAEKQIIAEQQKENGNIQFNENDTPDENS